MVPVFARLGLTARFAVVSLLATAFLGFALSGFLSNSIREHSLADLRAEAHDTVVTRVGEHISPADLEGPLEGERLEQFDRFIRESIISARTSDVVLWNPEGEIVYSLDRGRIGEQYPLDEDRQEAFAGLVISELPSASLEDDYGRDAEQVIEVYAPLTFPGGAEPAAILEIYQSYGPIASSIANMRRDLALGLGAGLAGLWAVLLGIVHGGARTIWRQHREIARELRQRKAAERARTLLADVVESTPDIVANAELDGTLRYVNRAGRAALGIDERAGVSGFNLLDSFAPGARKSLESEAIPRALRVGCWTGESVMIGRDGQEMPVSLVLFAHADETGERTTLTWVNRDIGDRKRFEEELLRLANHDALTGLFNRRRFEEELERQLAHARRFGTRTALLFLDLDGFKGVNDTAGHGAGNQLLASVAAQLRTSLREIDAIGRVGGDEFAIVLPQTDERQAEATAHRLLQAVREARPLVAARRLGVTASIGIAVAPEHGTDGDELLVRADLAMYRAKEERDAVCTYMAGLESIAHAGTRYRWQQRIKDALQQDRLFLECQPIQGLGAGGNRYELLLRLIDEEGRVFPPAAFLDHAERSGLIHAIDRWVVRRVIALAGECERSGQHLHFAVNLSAKAFADDQLATLIEEELERTGIDPASLTFEITETAAISDVHQAARLIERLRALGCRFAIDDFGVGFSSFYYLKHLPIDELKIDGSFIRNLSSDSVDQHLVRAIVEVARGLGKQTVAEFVEDSATLQILREIGVDFAQGYYIGRPQRVPGVDSQSNAA
jgi:diguanylate cyclase (GGDEF)-like protein/PAS domain S-box-containing protein